MQVGQKLGFVDWKNLLDGFDFQNDAALDDDIGPICSGQADAVIDQRQLDLALKRQTIARHFEAQTIHLNLFQ